jgi:hypothetical protein
VEAFDNLDGSSFCAPRCGNFGANLGGLWGKGREPQIILKADERNFALELGPQVLHLSRNILLRAFGGHWEMDCLRPASVGSRKFS